jgi:hypothetical protein
MINMWNGERGMGGPGKPIKSNASENFLWKNVDM